jgi:hypothetical protein
VFFGLGKIVTIYLSDDEARDLREFCDESRCTQYSVLKTAVRQLLYRPVQTEEEMPIEIDEEPEELQEEPIEEDILVEDSPEKPVQTSDQEELKKPDLYNNSLRAFLKYARAREQVKPNE